MEDELFDEKQIEVFIKRDDLIHSIVTGNKWRKLKEYLLIAQKDQANGIISFGGAYSNHIFALGYVCKELSIPLDLIIRGDELNVSSNHYLNQLFNWGIHLHFISREDYRLKNIPSSIDQFNKIIIPEGGFSEIGILSMKELAAEISNSFDYVFSSVGTGTTLLGLGRYLPKSKIVGVLSLSNMKEIEEHMNLLNVNNHNLLFFDQFIEKKYGKKNTELEEFCIFFDNKFHIKIEPIYTGLMVQSFYQLVMADFFKPQQKILLYHSGGIK